MASAYQNIIELERRHLIIDEALEMARKYPSVLSLEGHEIGALEEQKFQLASKIERLLEGIH